MARRVPAAGWQRAGARDAGRRAAGRCRETGGEGPHLAVLRRAGAPRLPGDQITVAVATCGRPASLARCLEALAKSTTRPRETIVVDQAPSPDSRQVVEQCGIEGALIYLEQPRLGTSAARNLALPPASGVVLATIDDDCAPDPGGVSALAAAFERDPRPVAVTGPVLALGPRPPGSHAISLRTDARAV